MLYGGGGCLAIYHPLYVYIVNVTMEDCFSNGTGGGIFVENALSGVVHFEGLTVNAVIVVLKDVEEKAGPEEEEEARREV